MKWTVAPLAPIFDAILDLRTKEWAKKKEGPAPKAYRGRMGEDDDDGSDTAYRVIADHIRTLTFGISGKLFTSPNHRFKRVARKKAIAILLDHAKVKIYRRNQFKRAMQYWLIMEYSKIFIAWTHFIEDIKENRKKAEPNRRIRRNVKVPTNSLFQHRCIVDIRGFQYKQWPALIVLVGTSLILTYEQFVT